jgi:hypothetical protein
MTKEELINQTDEDIKGFKLYLNEFLSNYSASIPDFTTKSIEVLGDYGLFDVDVTLINGTPLSVDHIFAIADEYFS